MLICRTPLDDPEDPLPPLVVVPTLVELDPPAELLPVVVLDPPEEPPPVVVETLPPVVIVLMELVLVEWMPSPPNTYAPATMRPMATITPTAPPIIDFRDMLIMLMHFR